MSSAKKVIPAVIPYDKDQFIKWASELNKFFSEIHIDVIDQSYDTPSWFNENEIFEILKGFKKITVHLMIVNPVIFLLEKQKYLLRDNVTYLLDMQTVFIDNFATLKDTGYKLGVVANPGVEPRLMENYYQSCDEFLFLTVNPGQSGQQPDFLVLTRLNTFLDITKLDFGKKIISVDGGFSEQNAAKFKETKVNIIYANSFFAKTGIEAALKTLSSLKINY